MFDHFGHLFWMDTIPYVEKITLIALRAFREFVREISFHPFLTRYLGIQVFDSDLVPVGWVDELDIRHFQEVLLSAEYRFQMILCYLTIW